MVSVYCFEVVFSKSKVCFGVIVASGDGGLVDD